MSLSKEAFRLRVFIFGLVFMPIVAVTIFGFTRGFSYRELKPLGQVGNFELLDQNGQTVTQNTFQNRIWIASFIFTHCGEQCPQITEKMKSLQKKLKGKPRIKLVSFSVDPERDTPARLLDYGRTLGADFEKWSFLTGDQKVMEELFLNRFKVNASVGTDGGLMHSAHFVLVDGAGYVRGYYNSEDAEKVKELIEDAKYLLGGLN